MNLINALKWQPEYEQHWEWDEALFDERSEGFVREKWPIMALLILRDSRSSRNCRWRNCEHAMDWCASEIPQPTTDEREGPALPGGNLWEIMSAITIILIYQEDFIIYTINNCLFAFTSVTSFKRRWWMSVRSDKPIRFPPAGSF